MDINRIIGAKVLWVGAKQAEEPNEYDIRNIVFDNGLTLTVWGEDGGYTVDCIGSLSETDAEDFGVDPAEAALQDYIRRAEGG